MCPAKRKFLLIISAALVLLCQVSIVSAGFTVSVQVTGPGIVPDYNKSYTDGTVGSFATDLAGSGTGLTSSSSTFYSNHPGTALVAENGVNLTIANSSASQRTVTILVSNGTPSNVFALPSSPVSLTQSVFAFSVTGSTPLTDTNVRSTFTDNGSYTYFIETANVSGTYATTDPLSPLGTQFILVTRISFSIPAGDTLTIHAESQVNGPVAVVPAPSSAYLAMSGAPILALGFLVVRRRRKFVLG